ncbi:hypothetical protein [uncultured Kordia sp.]|uniref:hypothetical protein n=1 Tax=uncultured Kordia sp. TaxID=507699 RepID=UPI00260AAA52|nr:hypothetical protein [uncultured Kordia sp.]
MFRNYILLLFCCIFHVGIAQKTTSELRFLEPDPFHLLNKYKKITNLHSEKFIYIAKKKIYNFKEDTIHVAFYDRHGNEVEKRAYFHNKIEYTSKKKYNRKGKKIHTTLFYSKRPKSVRHSILNYNTAGKLREIKGYRIKNNDTSNHSFTEFKYTKNKCTSKGIYNGNQLISGQHFKYDKKGNLIYMHTGEKPEYGTYIEYIYNDKSQIIKKLEYVKYANSNEKHYLYKSNFMYNKEGKMIKDSVFSESKKHWTVSDYDYNKKGLLAKINVKQNNYYRNATFTYVDNKLQKMEVLTNSNLSLKIFLNSTIYSAKMPATYEEFYTYDSQDRIKSTKIYVNSELEVEYLRHIIKL